ncbi:hypothetical protein ACLMJK_001687 [Lecanora helva]
MTTVPLPAHYNGRQQRIRFNTGKMGDELNSKTDSEYNIIKSSWESMHPDAGIMTFEEHVRLADEAYRRQHAGQPLSPNQARSIRFGNSHMNSSRDVGNSVRFGGHTQHSIFSQVSKGHSNANRPSQFQPGQSRNFPPNTGSHSSGASQAVKGNSSRSIGSASSSAMLEKLGVETPKNSSSQAETQVPHKSRLFKIPEDPEGYGLGTKFDGVSQATTVVPGSTAKHSSRTHLSQIPEKSVSHAPSSRSHHSETNSKHTAGAAARAPSKLSRIEEEPSRHGSSSSSCTVTQASTKHSQGIPGSSRSSQRLDTPSKRIPSSDSHHVSSSTRRQPNAGHSMSTYSSMSSGTIRNPHQG